MAAQPGHDEQPITITIKSAAARSGVCYHTILRKIESKELRSTKVGSRRLVYFDSLQELLRKGETADA